MSISTVTSEALQLKLRQLLPSQQGFGTDLSASDTIIPVIDLTAAAEGADVPAYLQNALSFGSQTSSRAINGSATAANTVGFWLVDYQLHASSDGGNEGKCFLNLVNGATVKAVVSAEALLTNNQTVNNISGSIVVYLDVNDSITLVSNDVRSPINVTVRNIADSNGEAINPAGFTPQ